MVFTCARTLLGDIRKQSEMTRHAAFGGVLMRCGLTLGGLMLLEGAARRVTRLSLNVALTAPDRSLSAATN
jgi:hypothetical protein